jgi:hypothetical protein
MDWQAMVLLGAYHGINPGMGWLFAVALGMQQGSARGVWRALPPIALGHAASVGIVVLTAALAGLVLPQGVLQMLVAATLTTFGLYRLWHHRHPRFGGMQVGFRDLTVWSFLMASAHGAGIMVLPFVMPAPPALVAGGHDHAAHMAALNGANWTAVAIHTLTYLVVMMMTAWIVYRRLGLRMLRSTWLNLDWLWAAALVVTGVVVLVR